MHRSFPVAALAGALFLIVPLPYAALAQTARAASVSAGGIESAAVLLDRYGEPALAWDALQRGGGPRSDAERRLAVRLLTGLRRYAEADSILARTPVPSGEYHAFLVRLQRARLNYASGRHARTLSLLANATAPDAALEAYRVYLLASVHLALRDPAAAAACLEQLEEEGVPDALRASLAEERVAAYRELDRPRDAMVAAAQAAAQTADAAEGRRLLALCYDAAREAGDAAQAVWAARELVTSHGASAEAGQVAADMVERDDTGRLGTGTLLACAEVLSAGNDAAALRRALRALDVRGLAGRDAEAHRILWSEYHYQAGDYSRAIALARPSYTDPALRRRSMLVMARSLRKLGRSTEAARVYEQFARDHPNDRLAAEALFAAASLYGEKQRAGDSARVLDQLRRSYPSTFHGWAAAMRRADDLARAGASGEAAAIYEQWLARSRRSDEAALFYLARVRERERAGAGAPILDELQALNRFSFYVAPDVAAVARGPLHDSGGGVLREGAGSLSDWLARAEAGRSLAYQRVLETATASVGPARGSSDRAVERGVFFLEAGLRDWAEHELEAARRGGVLSAEKALKLARLYDEFAMPWQSMRLYERARAGLPWQERRAHGDDFRVLTYPLPYPAQVLDNAARDGIPPHLIYGMIREESRFEADVVSRAGAVGLMQLMPQTARRVAAQLDLSHEMGDRLDEPAVNVSLGVWYAADLLRAGDDSVAWMLAAYNAGPGAAQRWVEPGVTGDAAIDAVESIDYKETRGYVKRVVESANVYHALYFSASPR